VAPFGELCEGDGECGTTDVRNCQKHGAYFDVYMKCGIIDAIDSSECPSNANIANCFDANIGELCEGDGECGTSNINNCGAYDVYRLCGVAVPVPIADCPSDPANLQNCFEAPLGALCLGDGKCHTDSILNNCGSHSVYRNSGTDARRRLGSERRLLEHSGPEVEALFSSARERVFI